MEEHFNGKVHIKLAEYDKEIDGLESKIKVRSPLRKETKEFMFAYRAAEKLRTWKKDGKKLDQKKVVEFFNKKKERPEGEEEEEEK